MSVTPGNEDFSMPHMVELNVSGTKTGKKKEKKERKTVKERASKAPRTPKDPIEKQDPLADLRQELKILTLKNAELRGSSDEELKKDLAKINRLKENDLKFQLEKVRVQTTTSWTKNLATCLTEGTGMLLDTVLKGDGHIHHEIKEDKKLEATVHSQLETIAFKMSPQSMIAMLLAVDTGKGWMKKPKKITPIISEKSQTPVLLTRTTNEESKK
jgi:hypothetical protein